MVWVGGGGATGVQVGEFLAPEAGLAVQQPLPGTSRLVRTLSARPLVVWAASLSTRVASSASSSGGSSHTGSGGSSHSGSGDSGHSGGSGGWVECVFESMGHAINPTPHHKHQPENVDD